MRYIIIIPARWSSSRFPGKPLAKLCGKTVINRVWERCRQVVEDVYVATDDERIADEVSSFGGRAIMTRADHRSGTDRCLEAMETIIANREVNPTDCVVINVQGDEPLIEPEQIRQLMSCFDGEHPARIATLIRPFDPAHPVAELENPNIVKVEVDFTGRALTFSRSVVPYLRGIERREWPLHHTFFTHIGMYAYHADALREIAALLPSSLEVAESLEQMRWIQRGYTVHTAVSEYPTVGIDTPADLDAAEKLLENR